MFLALVIALLGALGARPQVLHHEEHYNEHRSINNIADDDDEKAVERRRSLGAAADPNDAAAAADDDGDAGTSNGNRQRQADARQRIVNQTIYAELCCRTSCAKRLVAAVQSAVVRGARAAERRRSDIPRKTRINCRSDEASVQGRRYLGIFVYQSIPLVWFVCLWRVRHELNPRRRQRPRRRRAPRPPPGSVPLPLQLL